LAPRRCASAKTGLAGRIEEFIDNSLGEYNVPFLRDPSCVYFGIFLHNEAGVIRAELIGNAYAGWLSANLLWTYADLPRSGIGRPCSPRPSATDSVWLPFRPARRVFVSKRRGESMSCTTSGLHESNKKKGRSQPNSPGVVDYHSVFAQASYPPSIRRRS